MWMSWTLQELMLYQAEKEEGDQSIFVEKREEETLLISFHAMNVADQGVQVLDSGFSNHIQVVGNSSQLLMKVFVLLFVL